MKQHGGFHRWTEGDPVSTDPRSGKATTLNLSSDPRALNHGKTINMVGQSLNVLTFVEFRGEEWHLKLSPGIVIPLFVAGFWIKFSTRVFFLYMRAERRNDCMLRISIVKICECVTNDHEVTFHTSSHHCVHQQCRGWKQWLKHS